MTISNQPAASMKFQNRERSLMENFTFLQPVQSCWKIISYTQWHNLHKTWILPLRHKAFHKLTLLLMRNLAILGIVQLCWNWLWKLIGPFYIDYYELIDPYGIVKNIYTHTYTFIYICWILVQFFGNRLVHLVKSMHRFECFISSQVMWK